MPPQLCLCQAVSLSEARGFRRRVFTIIVVRPPVVPIVAHALSA
ncbi:hypothetical protein FB001_10232 [Ensifer sp. SEMIA 135]|nr:hypothetical protein SinmeB_4131 [Sinorhizobium meliloti BL225C]TWB05661.1 hypothetical protein FB000_10113 [Ensifer sp. SEMIA 134]TWB40128.1 hypothetical protein FB001_10232 [Ensifer sp. SEMIA 135]SDW56780.1 hypothetical protein SAMN04244576_00358 [Sinorhizobium meliloti]